MFLWSVYQWDATLPTPLYYSHLRQVTLDLHPPTTMHWWLMKDGAMNLSSTHPLQSPFFLKRKEKVCLIWFPGKYGPQQQQQFAFKSCSSYMPHACKSLKGAFAFWMPENAQTQKLKIPFYKKENILDLMRWRFNHLLVIRRNYNIYSSSQSLRR